MRSASMNFGKTFINQGTEWVNMPISILYVTHPNQKVAKSIVTNLLTKRLIACANLFPAKAVYRWNGKIQASSEVISILKTKPEIVEKVEREIKKMHPYKVPCIISLKVESNKEFGDWVNKEIMK